MRSTGIERDAPLQPAIVVAAFSRPRALQRLLDSLNAAEYPAEGVHLVISIDGGGPSSVVEVARRFVFQHGPVQIVERSENLGLRKHILWCGDQSIDHEAVIVLEDDLVVDRYFYAFAAECLRAYATEEAVAGVALYSPRYNEFAALPFEPLFNGTSTYFSQVPCSSGQAWTKAQWSKFRAWYGDGSISLIERANSLPDVVRAWPETSWKKYFAAYLVLLDRYFVYPYQAYTTNCSDPGGAHISRGTHLFQVPLGWPGRRCETFVFATLAEIPCRYDAFMEPEAAFFEGLLGLGHGSLAVDLYGIKPTNLLKKASLVLTSRAVSEARATFSLTYRPIEVNFSVTDMTDTPPFFALADVANVKFEQRAASARLVEYSSSSPILSIRFLISGFFLAVSDRVRNFKTRLLKNMAS